MLQRLSLVLAALSLAACASVPVPSILQAPAPLAATAIDDTALETAWRGFDLALDAINILGDQGVIVPGSAKGKRVALAIRNITAALSAAERFAAAGSSPSYLAALREAKAGIADLRSLLKG